MPGNHDVDYILSSFEVRIGVTQDIQALEQICAETATKLIALTGTDIYTPLQERTDSQANILSDPDLEPDDHLATDAKKRHEAYQKLLTQVAASKKPELWEEDKNETLVAEEKIAMGIKTIYDSLSLKKVELKYDRQGIAIVTLNAEKLKTPEFKQLVDCFPNKLEHGLTIHLYKPGYIKHPPTRYLIEQKVKSLCDMAEIKYGKISRKEIQKAIRKKIETAFNALKLLDLPIQEEKEDQHDYQKKYNEAEEKNAELFHEMSAKLVATCTGLAIDMLHKKLAPEKLTKKFAMELSKMAQAHRSTDTDTLTFNEEMGKFSLDLSTRFPDSDKSKPSKAFTAHDKKLGNHCSNLSMIFDGVMWEKTKENPYDTSYLSVTSTTTKHCSLAPDKNLPGHRSFSEKNIHHIIQACNNLEDVLLTQATYRQHGRKDKDKNKPMHIDHLYQLLTTNATPILFAAKEPINYGIAIDAAHLMDGATLKTGNLNVTVNTHTLNAGINFAGGWNAFQKTDTQRIENRKAYTHATEMLKKTTIPPQFSALQNLIAPKPAYGSAEYQLTKNYKALREKLAEKTNLFNQQRRKYNIQFTRAKKDDRHTFLDRIDTSAMENTLKKVNVLQQELRILTYKMEQKEKARWKTNKDTIKTTIDNLIKTTEINQLTTDELDTLNAFVYKSLLDNLYYSGEYREPKNAALFNVYLLAYQRAIGMSSSMGCKSANDRTMVIGALYAALGHENRNHISGYHQEGTEDHDRLMERTKYTIMSNRGVYSCIHDNAAATPQINTDKFEILKPITSVNYFYEFSKYAAHRIKKIIDAIIKVFKQDKKAEKQSHPASFFQPTNKSKAADTHQSPASTPPKSIKSKG